MVIARNKIFDPNVLGYYHCIIRCVRRSYLCGDDKVTGKNFDYRREWIKNRLSYLLEIFAIDCFAYAVMSNHLHTVIRNNPEVSKSWSNEEVARRWRKLFPKYKDIKDQEEDICILANDDNLVEKYRERLTSISWFNRCMNENIARRANKEDECKGRFWEGRFISQKLESESAVVACGIYVDLNPVRAGISDTPENSDYTSIQDRVNEYRQNSLEESEQVVNCPDTPRLIKTVELSGLKEIEYIELVDKVGKQIKPGKKFFVDPELIPIIERLKMVPEQLVNNSLNQSHLFKRVVGSINELKTFAERIGQKYVQGIVGAKLLFISNS